MKLTYFGHSCFLLETSKSRILFDPFIRSNELAKDVNVDSIECDYVFISHGHFDHVEDAEEILKRTGATLVSNWEIVAWFEAKGIEGGHRMNFGGCWEFDFGRAHFVHAVHSSSLPDGSYGGNPGGFIIEADDQTIYYSGDTALTQDMKLWGERFNFDAVMLPIGDNFTMGPIDATHAAEFLQCNRVIGMHYDTFGYIEIDHQEVQNLFAKTRTDLSLIKIGETIEI